MKLILKHFFRFFLNIPYFLACLIPREKELWLFGSWFGQKYLDNPKYIYLFTIKKPDIKAIWFTKNKKLFREMRSEGLPVVYSASLRGVWLQLRCGVVVYTHAVHEEFTPFLIASRVFRVQAWHGVPIKKIGYDDEKSKLTRRFQRVRKMFFPFRTDRCDLVLAVGLEDSKIFRSAFNVESDRVVITGFPRNDALFDKSSSIVTNGKKLKRFLYMPTFRGEPGSEFLLLEKSGFDYLAYDKAFSDAGIQLEIKLHPVQVLSQKDAFNLKNCNNIKLVKEGGDIYSLMSQFDALVTDYSSIFFDFLLTGKPIFMAPFDLDSYLLNDRSMYYKYQDICPSKVCLNWEELFACIVETNYDYEKYNDIIRRFHFYVDGFSSKRSFEEIFNHSQ